ncbi:transglutaminase-like protein [Gordonia spumicola]|uniref:Transglutaminase-like protein n=1 Tax=Gordonia spumicola TaxID=589161 RepID=A0A7I9VB69_9ACTN|nr:transglutaminase family protein [Gordonia spumicola]GEE02514.1 transglutaminase-like protein [Gordonia spumicola]
MARRLRVVHTTGYTYAGPATSSFNEARLTPHSDARQNVVAEHVDVSPPARLFRYTDYWGTTVSAFDLHSPHDRLEVVSSAVVETDAENRSDEALSATWERLAGDDVLDEFDEMLTPTAYVPHRRSLAAFAADVAGDLRPADAVTAIASRVHREMTYEPGTTEVTTAAPDAWRRRSGVCQDFAHITLAMVRSLGIPARYVSGYLHPRPDAGIGDAVDGESHAWVDVWTGGWWGVDPTNDILITDRHISVGVGRDYADVPPFNGIYTGTAASDLDVSVRITWLA